jgi:hypothetical protein
MEGMQTLRSLAAAAAAVALLTGCATKAASDRATAPSDPVAACQDAALARIKPADRDEHLVARAVVGTVVYAAPAALLVPFSHGSSLALLAVPREVELRSGPAVPDLVYEKHLRACLAERRLTGFTPIDAHLLAPPIPPPPPLPR